MTPTTPAPTRPAVPSMVACVLAAGACTSILLIRLLDWLPGDSLHIAAWSRRGAVAAMVAVFLFRKQAVPVDGSTSSALMSLPVAAAGLVAYLASLWLLRIFDYDARFGSRLTQLIIVLAVTLLVSWSRREPVRWLRPIQATERRYSSQWVSTRQRYIPVLGWIPVIAIMTGVLVESLVPTGALGPAGTYNDLASSATTSDRWIAYVGAVFVAVVFEELLYRGLLLTAIHLVTGRAWFAIVVSSATWALAHGGVTGGYNAAQVAGLFAEGLVYGWAAVRYRSLLPGLVGHHLHNAGASADPELVGTVPYAMVLIAAATTIWMAGFMVLRRPGLAQRTREALHRWHAPAAP